MSSNATSSPVEGSTRFWRTRAPVGPFDADDCYQETWLSALAAYPRLRDASNLRAWILTIAHRKAIDHTRSRARRAVPVAEVGEAVDASQAAAEPGPGQVAPGQLG